jgi:hypothetical protein
MIRTTRSFFLSRALREKLLLVAFIVIGVLWWGSSFLTRSGAFWTEQRAMTSRLKVNAEWIKNQSVIEQNEKKTAASLQPEKTLNANQLLTTVNQIAAESGLKNITTSGTLPSSTSGQFAVHSQEFVIRNVEWESLSRFYEALQKRSPYIAIERFTLRATGNNAAQLELSLKVTSMEIRR